MNGISYLESVAGGLLRDPQVEQVVRPPANT